MRVCVAMLAGVMALLFGGTAFAMDTVLNSVADQGGALIHAVKLGDAFDIVGDCFDVARSTDDVRVVLKMADRPNASGAGYSAVLVTEQHLGENVLHVRVPEMPELANHVFRVRVFALGGSAPATCDAGSIRIS
jgi:hypothetical protein